MSIYAIALVLVIITNAIISYFVIFDKKKSLQKIGFLLITLSTSLWAVSNYIVENDDYKIAFIGSRFAYLLGLMATLSVWYFSLYFPKKYAIKKIEKYIFIPIILFTVAISGTSFVASDIVVSSTEATAIKSGSLYAPYAIVLVLLFFSSIAHFLRSYRDSNLTEKQQIKFTLIGIIFGFSWIFGTAVAIPSLVGNWQISLFSSVGVTFLTSFVAYAMLKHQLFDIRAAFARASAYVLVLGFTVVIYTFVVFGLFEKVLLVDLENETLLRAIYISFAVVTALIFQNTKSYFDRITSKIFYRDSYDPQQLYDELSNLMVTTYQIEQLADRSAEIIEKHLKVQYCTYYIESASRQHLFGTKRDGVLVHADTLFETLKNEKSIVVTGSEKNKEHKKTLPKLVYDAEIGLIAKVSTTNQYIGILMLGEKKSGSKFSKIDLKVIDIVVDQLALAFENAVRFEQISMFNITLQQKINDATQELRSSNTKLQELDEAKDEFISMASHQLRTPLTSVKGYVSMVLEGDAGEINDQQKQLLNQAFFSSQRMVYLISDLLNVSRLKTGKFVIESQEIYLPDIVEEEMQQLIETAKSRKLELFYEKPSEFPVVMLDETKTRQIIMNFIDNAIYYTPAGGKIEVELSATSHSIDFRVIDNGLGVPKKDQQHLFTKFFRAGNAKKARPDGTGLGLFMAKKVVVAQGGAIIFKSQEGKGSTFGFTFQLDKIKKPISPPVESQQTDEN